jgi:hypothetical protein
LPPAGRPRCYPLAALRDGVAWPADVDPSAREEWLGGADWAAAFGGLSLVALRALPGWRRERLKREARLF